MPSHYYKKHKKKKGWLKVWTDERHSHIEPKKDNGSDDPRDPVYIPVPAGDKRRPHRPPVRGPIRLPGGHRLGRPNDNINPFAPSHSNWLRPINNAISGLSLGAAASILGYGKYLLPFI